MSILAEISEPGECHCEKWLYSANQGGGRSNESSMWPSKHGWKSRKGAEDHMHSYYWRLPSTTEVAVARNQWGRYVVATKEQRGTCYRCQEHRKVTDAV